MNLADPRAAHVFRFVRASYAHGVAELVYAFDAGTELVERIRFPDGPDVPAGRERAFAAALRWLHLIAGVSYYKAGIPRAVEVVGQDLDGPTVALLDGCYRNGLAEFAYRNQLRLPDPVGFEPTATAPAPSAPSAGLPHSVLIPLGGGKDSLVAVEAIKHIGAAATVAWVGQAPIIAACAERTGLPAVNVGRELSPVLFEYNHMGAYNGHIPVTAVNSAIMVLVALLYGHDVIAFANERSASAATLESDGHQVNHQWSKGLAFERDFARHVHSHVAADLTYCSLLRPFSELAVAAAFARLCTAYTGVFSSCNRNFRILGPKPADRWCGHCPKCHFVFLALAPFLPKPEVLGIFGRNLLDDGSQAPGFDALMEYHEHKPFECVGEAAEARAAMAALTQRPEWAEDAIVQRFRREILPQLDGDELVLKSWLRPFGEHHVPTRLLEALDAIRSA